MSNSENPYAAPESNVATRRARRGPRKNYANFGLRLAAYIVDVLVTLIVTIPLGFLLFPGFDFLDDTTHPLAYTLLSYLLPAVYTITFWVSSGATPGKMALGIRIVDANGNPPGIGTCLLRYIGYFISAIACLMGFFWMLWDNESQTWHDKISSTFVVTK